MATFFIPGDLIAAVSVGGTAPETGFFSARIESVEAHPTRVHSRKIKVVFDNGFSVRDWLTTPCDVEGNLLAQYKAPEGKTEANPTGMTSQAFGCIKHIKEVLMSAGFDNNAMSEGGVTDDWVVGKTVYVEWHSGKDLGSQYGELVNYITPAQFESNKAENKVPAIAASNNETSNVVTTAPSNGVTATPAPSTGMKLPPPPSAQNIVN